MKIEININDRLINFFQYIFSGKRLVFTFTTAIIITSAIVYSAATVPYTFTKGGTISSSQVNTNFQALSNKINELESRIEGVPTGTIVPFAGQRSNVPSGWLLCDGTSLERDYQYNNLYQVIDIAWGAEDTDHFNLPDLRGLFLRGVDNGAGNDPNAGSRIGIQQGLYNAGSTGDNVGSYQADEYKKHTHSYKDVFYVTGNHNGKMTGEFDAHDENGWGYDHNRTTGISGSSPETRPKNAYVNYIIKY